MVSFHTPLSPTQRKTLTELENSTKKRKWEETVQVDELFRKPLKAKSTKSLFDTELNLETPLPLEWQRCLDIKSGEIHYYNMRTQKRTSEDPRIGQDHDQPPSSSTTHMSLDLELNLLCGTNNNSGNTSNNNISDEPFTIKWGKNKENSEALMMRRCPSWLAFEDHDDHQAGDDEREMVTAVCNKCHMLVMMCKSSPECPNCKFMHPPDQTPPNLFKQRLSLLC